MQKFLDNEITESLSITLIIHSIILLICSFITIQNIDKNTFSLVIDNTVNDLLIDENNVQIEDFVFIEEDFSIISNDISSIENPDTEILSVEEPTIVNEIVEISSNDFSLQQISSTIVSNSSANIAETISVGQALDALTIEIVSLSKNSDVNVIWLFDSSISLNNQRQYLHDRFDKILYEIEQTKSLSNKVEHIICSFGEATQILSDKFSSDNQYLKTLIRSIQTDYSGIENVFSSINYVISHIKKQRKTKNVIVIFTDEPGDDLSELDLASYNSRKNGYSIYAVAPPSPFGKQKALFKFVDPDEKYDQTERWIEIDQGPETAFKMILNLKSLPIDNLVIDSGFGFYGLSKICSETGGLYFSLHPNRQKSMVSKKDIDPLSIYISIFVDSNLMQRYKPDYRPINTQVQDITNSLIKSNLIKACQIELNISADQKTKFVYSSEADFVDQLNNAQRFSAQLEPKIQQIYQLLFSVENAKNSLKDNRWIASYYLAYGRILITKCRVELYNSMLANAKSGLRKTQEKSNTWILVANEQLETNNSQLKKQYELSVNYLKYVIDNFPNTPWAIIAQAELDLPVGYIWIEDFTKIESVSSNNNNNNNLPKDDKKREIEKKPLRKVDKI